MLSETLKLRKNQCKICPFLLECQHIIYPSRWDEIYQYLLKGTNHTCHSTNMHICRGGRNWQLRAWCSTNTIKEPTDKSLFEAMRSNGIEPLMTEIENI